MTITRTIEFEPKLPRYPREAFFSLLTYLEKSHMTYREEKKRQKRSEKSKKTST
jgi:hypothetical protein